MKFILTLVAVALFAVPNLAHAQVSVAERLVPGKPPVIVATGRMRDSGYPDDSLAGMQWALDRGVDMLVVRVRLTGDGKYVVLNEGVLTRTTDVRDVFPDGAPRRDPGDAVAKWHIVADYTLEEIKQLRLLDPQGGEHQVPTLDEALDLIDGRTFALLALEDYKVESLAALLANRERQNMLLFDAVDLPKLRAITAATGIGAWGAVFDAHDKMAALDKRAGMFGSDLKVVDVEQDQLDPEIIARAEKLGVSLCLRGMGWEDIALAAGNTKPWLQALEGPTTLFMTEYPDAVLKLLGR